MNLIVIKYCLLIGAILASTSVVAGPLNPQHLFSDPEDAEITADAIYQFGSDVYADQCGRIFAGTAPY